MLTKALTFSHGGTKYCVKTQGPGTAMRGAKIAVHRFTDGRLRFSCKDRVLSCTAYGTHAVPDPAEVEKTLDARLDLIARRAASPPVMSPHWLPEPVQPAGAECAIVLSGARHARAQERAARGSGRFPSAAPMVFNVPGRDGKADAPAEPESWIDGSPWRRRRHYYFALTE